MRFDRTCSNSFRLSIPHPTPRNIELLTYRSFELRAKRKWLSLQRRKRERLNRSVSHILAGRIFQRVIHDISSLHTSVVCRSYELIQKRVGSITVLSSILLHVFEVVIPCVYFMEGTHQRSFTQSYDGKGYALKLARAWETDDF